MTERGELWDAHSHESGERELERAPADELAAGTLVAGKYRVKAVLGRGGFAVVYDAEHVGLGRDVALKVLHRRRGTPQVLIDRFLREVRISALVRHPNVLEVYDAGVYEDGSPFLVMEKIVGLTLHQQLCLCSKLSVDETRSLSRQLLLALVAIAERGIVHRDIKPENLMLSFNEGSEVQLKLVDFGIALVEGEPFAARLTQQGALVGTPHYMAPEQLRCERVDARVDVYAAGVVMYQMLTGALPHDGSDLSSLTLSVLHGKARALESLCLDCPRSLARLIERALSRESDGRFPDARSMLCALEACGPMAAQPSTTLAWAQAARRRIKEAARRPREMMVVGATLALCALWSGHTAIAEAVRSGFPHAFQQPTESAHGVRGTPDVTPDAAGAAALQASALVQEEAPQPPSRALEATPPAARPATKPATLPGSAARTSEAVQPQAHDRAPDALVRARALSKKGLLLYLHAELDAAYAVYRQASLLAPDEPAAFRGLGLAASRLGRTYEARRAFTRYLELAPDAADARLIRARLAQLISEEATRGLRSAHNEPPPA